VSDFWGPLIVETDVDAAVINTLRLWLPMYLSQIERERELTPRLIARPEPDQYQNVLEDDTFPDVALPAVLVTTAQPSDVAMDGDGVWSAAWRVRVSVVVRGRTAPETRAVAALFKGAVTRVMLHQSSLGGFAAGVELQPGGGVAPIADETDKGRYLASGMGDFLVFTHDVVQSGVGPETPSDPYPEPDPVGNPDESYDPLAAVAGVKILVNSKET
jgi:hypothetical protein